MAEWKEYKIKDAPFEIIDGDRGTNYPSQNEFYSSGHCLFLSAKNVKKTGFDFSERQFISEEKDNILRKGKLKRNDTVLTTRGTVGNLAFYSNEVPFDNIRINSGMVIIRPLENELKPKFCFYLFRALQQNHFQVFSSGSAQPQLPIRDLNEIEISIPEPDEQQAMAEVLSSLDDKIDLLHRQNKTLEALAETLFRQWFVEEAEGSWRTGAVKDLINILSGFAFKSSDFVENGKYRLITIKSVQDGYLDLSRTDRLNEIPKRMSGYCLLGNGDILLSLTGNVGRCCLVDEENLLLNQRVAKLQAKRSRDWAFTYVMFRLPSMRRMLEELAKGTAQANLSPIETANMAMQIPPDDLLEKYSEKATPLLEKLLRNKNQISTLTHLRDALLPKLMSGEVRVELSKTESATAN